MEEEAAEEEAARSRGWPRPRRSTRPASRRVRAPAQPPQRREPGAVVLAANGTSVSFGGLRAVDEVDLEVEEGQLVGLIGPNGAGKTTFIDAITRVRAAPRAVALDGADSAGLEPHAPRRRGLARTWQAIELFDDLTVRENLTVAALPPSAWSTPEGGARPPVAAPTRSTRPSSCSTSTRSPTRRRRS